MKKRQDQQALMKRIKGLRGIDPELVGHLEKIERLEKALSDLNERDQQLRVPYGSAIPIADSAWN